MEYALMVEVMGVPTDFSKPLSNLEEYIHEHAKKDLSLPSPETAGP